MGTSTSKVKAAPIVLYKEYTLDSIDIDFVKYSKKDKKAIKHHNADINHILQNKTINEFWKYMNSIEKYYLYSNPKDHLMAYRPLNDTIQFTFENLDISFYANILGQVIIAEIDLVKKKSLINDIVTMAPEILNESCIALYNFKLDRIPTKYEIPSEYLIDKPIIRPINLGITKKLPLDILKILIPTQLKCLDMNRNQYLIFMLLSLSLNRILNEDEYQKDNNINDIVGKILNTILESLSNFIESLANQSSWSYDNSNLKLQNTINIAMNMFKDTIPQINETIDIVEHVDTISQINELYKQAICGNIINILHKTSAIKDFNIEKLTNGECCICLSTVKELDDTTMGITKCGHHICQLCYHNNLSRQYANNICPLCSVNLKTNDFYAITA